jgi:hypothetical protein
LWTVAVRGALTLTIPAPPSNEAVIDVRQPARICCGKCDALYDALLGIVPSNPDQLEMQRNYPGRSAIGAARTMPKILKNFIRVRTPPELARVSPGKNWKKISGLKQLRL